jgi:succinate dehydrogenase/fumarate reductase flavoprotein subunit
MLFKDNQEISCDVLVIGGGGAGLRAAIAAREMAADVLIVSKTRVGYGNNTYVSKATLSATGWGNSQDNRFVHMRDTLKGGRYLNDPGLVDRMAEDAPGQIAFLEKCGVRFMKKQDHMWMDHHPGHSYPRSIRAAHRTGSDLMLPLRAYAKKVGVRFAERVFITKLFRSLERAAGATGITDDGAFVNFVSNCVILATGGYGHVYSNTNNAPGISGDGQALAFDLGVPLKDMEFVQFYPTAMGKFGSRILLYEVFLARARSKIKNIRGEDIIIKHGLEDPMVMTRDRLSRAIMQEMMEGLAVEEGVSMDLSGIPENKAAHLRDLLPVQWSRGERIFTVTPTTHFCMGGVEINKEAETSLPGLFAAGEICAGVHGANRLSGNALSEVFTIGGTAGRSAAQRARELGPPEISGQEVADERARLASFFSTEGEHPKTLRRSLKEAMWKNGGIIRDHKTLEKALAQIEEIRSRAQHSSIEKHRDLAMRLELQNSLLIGEMICRSALFRKESRGAHYRSDFPEEDNRNWLKNTVIVKEETGMRMESVPVDLAGFDLE